jgi:hypothetical protein
MSKESSINTYLTEDGFELTAVPDSQMDLVLRQNPLKWSKVVERPPATRGKSPAKSTDEKPE